MKIKVDDKSLKEQIPYPDMSFPFFVWLDIYNKFSDHTVNRHWHYDFEYGYVLLGVVDYYINDTYIKLKEGDCIFVNSNMLHMSRQSDNCDNAMMFTITFSTTLLTTNINSTVYKKHFQPIIDKPLEGFRIAADNPFCRPFEKLMKELFSILIHEYMRNANSDNFFYRYLQPIIGKPLEGFKIASDSPLGRQMEILEEISEMDVPSSGYELECMNRAIQILILTLKYIEESRNNLLWHTGSIQPIERAKAILAYIHSHYKEKITVEKVAMHLNISRSECFRCFKRLTNKSPTDYINEYRLSIAAKQLRETEKSIIEIITECGFSSPSYFGKMFKETYSMSPLQYRKYKED